MDVKKTLLGIPTNRGLKPKTALSLLELVNGTKYQLSFIMATEGYTISENRNYLVAQAIKGGYDYLLMIDDDMVFPENTLDKLIEANKDIVGVVSNSRTLPPRPTIEILDDSEITEEDDLMGNIKLPKELFECKAVGGGVILIDLSIFAKWKAPWFDTINFPTGMVKVGEDSYFCHKARDKGFGVYADPTLKIGHIGDFIY